MQEIMDKIVAKLKAMPQEEFDQLIEQHRNGDIAIALRELNEFSEYLECK